MASPRGDAGQAIERVAARCLMDSAGASDRALVDDLAKEFIAESLESLERTDVCLTQLEVRPEDGELLGEIFRCIHTIKGTTGFLGLPRLETLAHAGEHLLGALRAGALIANGPIIDALLELVDRIRLILDLIGLTGHEGRRPSDNDRDLIALLDGLGPGGAAPMVRHAGSSAADDLVFQAAQALQVAQTARAAQAAATLARNPQPETQAANVIPDNTVRIDVEVLDRLMNLVGELVLTRNQLLQNQVEAANSPQFARRLDSVTTDLRETVMQARLRPVGHLFGKFPRMVRDLARMCGKTVRIEFEGQETGLDKSLLEAIKDPLTHAVRNCVDHGIETPEDRLRVGKPAEGLVSLRATHRNGWVQIEITDDGGGISVQRLLAKAVEREAITEAEAAAMSEQDALQLVFLPGLSTAETVSHVSGRGVGMDVVRANIEKAGGSVELQSTLGVGTSLRMRVPLTLAIVPALIVESGGQSFCLPQSALAELVYVAQRDASEAIERLGETELYRLRDHLLPLIRLDNLLEMDPAERTRREHGFYIAILDVDGCRFGLVVDELMAPEEIVVKPLSSALLSLGLFSGAAVLGNGLLSLILDVAATAIRAGVRASAQDSGGDVAEVKADAAAAERSFLVYENCYTQDFHALDHVARTALPLEVVERIETVPASQVEFANGRALLQYRGDLLPLEDSGNLLPQLIGRSPEAMVTILICKRQAEAQANSNRLSWGSGRGSGRLGESGNQHAGIVVSRVLDVAQGEFVDDDRMPGDGCLAMIAGRVTRVEMGYYAGSEDLWKEVA